MAARRGWLWHRGRGVSAPIRKYLIFDQLMQFACISLLIPLITEGVTQSPPPVITDSDASTKERMSSDT